jgi:hypothetical protein
MSRRPSKKREKKHKKREQLVRKNRRALSTRRELKTRDRLIRHHAPLPEFRVDASESGEDIKAMVESAINRFNGNYTRFLDDDTLVLMAIHVAKGWTSLIDQQAARITDMTREDIESAILQLFEQELGNRIIQNAPRNLIRRSLPTSCFTLSPGEHHWIVRCRSLRADKTEHGGVYQSPHRPTVQLNGKDHEVVFTRHALQQLSSRMLPDWSISYIGQAYVFGFFYECVYFEVERLNNGDNALVVYNSCLRAGERLRHFMCELLNVDDQGELANHYYKVGYCPIVVDSGLAIAKTFLTPGYWQTPERLALSGRRMTLIMRQDIELACDDGINISSICSCEKTRTALKWFHNHGVPQAKRIDREVFKGLAGPYACLDSKVGKLLTPLEGA